MTHSASGQIFWRFGLYHCETVVSVGLFKVWLTLDGIESRQTISTHLTPHSFEEDDASQRTFISVKIDYNTKDYGEEFSTLGRLKVHAASICRHVGAEKENMSCCYSKR